MQKISILFLFCLIILPSIIFAQISISQTDFTSYFSIGSTHTSFEDTLAESVDIGQLGGPNNWDFSNFVPHNTFEISYISPVGTPFADTFATANTVGYSQFSFEDNGTEGTGEAWTYYSANDGATHGSGSIFIFNEMGASDTSINIAKHIPPLNQYDFPIEINKTWFVQDSIENLIISSEGNFTTVQKITYDIVIDAWGTMKLPSGKIVDALRLREKSISTSFIFGIPIGSSVFVEYFFMTKSGESFSVLTNSEDPPTSGVVSGSIGWSDDAVTDVKKIETIPEGFSLKQNYPNPFNPSTIIEYSITESSVVKLKIYDILGNEVAELVNKIQPPGSYRYSFNANNLSAGKQGLSSGTYLIQLQAGNNIDIKKMTLLK